MKCGFGLYYIIRAVFGKGRFKREERGLSSEIRPQPAPARFKREERGLSSEIRPQPAPLRLPNMDAGLANRVSHPKSGTNSSQLIPSPFMGEG